MEVITTVHHNRLVLSTDPGLLVSQLTVDLIQDTHLADGVIEPGRMSCSLGHWLTILLVACTFLYVTTVSSSETSGTVTHSRPSTLSNVVKILLCRAVAEFLSNRSPSNGCRHIIVIAAGVFLSWDAVLARTNKSD